MSSATAPFSDLLVNPPPLILCSGFCYRNHKYMIYHCGHYEVCKVSMRLTSDGMEYVKRWPEGHQVHQEHGGAPAGFIFFHSRDGADSPVRAFRAGENQLDVEGFVMLKNKFCWPACPAKPRDTALGIVLDGHEPAHPKIPVWLNKLYMKYLYPYECEKRSLSSPTELQAAIDGNRREGRRSSYGTYAEMVQRSPGLGAVATSLAQQMSPLSLVTAAGRPTVNGVSSHHNPQHPLSLGPTNGLGPHEFEARMAKYVKLLDKELRRTASTTPTGRQAGGSSPPPSTSPREALNALEMSRLTLWNLYHNSFHEDPRAPVPPPPPQREALNLEDSRQQQVAAAAAEQARAIEAAVKKEKERMENGPNPPKRPHISPEEDMSQHTKLPFTKCCWGARSGQHQNQ